MKIQPRIAGIPASVTLKITSKAKAMKAEGRKVISFAAGEPDFDTPEHIKAAAAAALARGETKYAPVPGLPDLRTAIAEKLQRDNGLHYTADQVVVSNGAKHSLFNVFMALCGVGDEVIIPAPYWLSYPEMAKVVGAEPVIVNCPESDDFKLRPDAFEAAITTKTRAIVINSPSNPIGVVYTRDELAALADVAVKHGIAIIADEIYEKMVYDGVEHVSIGSLSPEAEALTVTVNGFSKSCSMTGWRLGYIAAPLDLVKAITSFQSHTTSSPNTFAQYGALEALRGSQEPIAEMVAAFSERARFIYERLSVVPGISCVKPMGAFYVLPNISSYGMDSLTFAERLLESKEVAVVPGAAFGADANVRLSYACSLDDIKEGCDRIEAFVQGLG